MKRNLVVGLLGVGLVLGLGFLVQNESEYIAPAREVVQVEKEVLPEWAKDEEAVKAAQDVIRKKELEAQEAELVGEISTLQTELDEVRKELGTYWRDPRNVKAHIREVFADDPHTAVAVAECESGFAMVQSHHMQSYGRERSFGVFQIHEPDWHETALRLGLPDYQTDVEQNIQMARYIYEKRGNTFKDWTCAWHPNYLALY